ncbi:MAG TPA: 2-succinyl-5-enolpyruvyl-6-hydroxy-3-cyclohexene-1-carboxylic-acid synthase, partial [Thermaerobacter sp.]
MAETREPVHRPAPRDPQATGPAPAGARRAPAGSDPADLGTVNLRWALALVDGLVAAGVEHVVVCPGSRSSPLALAAARHPGVRLWVQLDERSAGFFALGIGRATGRPAAVVATSGTAPANFYPAVIEARYGRVPLVVLSADRPHELREFGAAQTVDQIHLYGRHAKWFYDLPLPEDDPTVRDFARRAAVRAVAEALAAPAGPVHLNVPFREPLVPAASADAAGRGSEAGGPERSRADGEQGREVAVGAFGPGRAAGGAGRGRAAVGDGLEPRLAPAALTAAQAHELLSVLAGARRGVIVCGPLAPTVAAAPAGGPTAGSGGGAPAAVPGGPPLAAAVTRLARRLGLPVLADPLSGVRWGPHL